MNQKSAQTNVRANDISNIKTVEFRKYIETEVLKIIKQLAEEKKTPEDKIKAIAQLTLDLIKPEMNLEELYLNAVKLDDQYSELAPVVFHIMKEYEEKYEKKGLDQVTQLIRGGNFDQAQDMVKKILLFKTVN